MSDAERERVVFLARCAVIEDIAYGLTDGNPKSGPVKFKIIAKC